MATNGMIVMSLSTTLSLSTSCCTNNDVTIHFYPVHPVETRKQEVSVLAVSVPRSEADWSHGLAGPTLLSAMHSMGHEQ